MKLYAISGLGADKRVFQFLHLDYELIHIDWIINNKNETLESYAKRLSQAIDTTQKYALIGLSFGGLVAIEMSKFLNPEITILISSAQVKKELPLVYRIFGKLHLISLIPTAFFNIPRKPSYYFFGTEKKELLNQIIDDTDLSFAKWSVSKLFTWQNTTYLKNVVKISGTIDKLIPPTKNDQSILVEEGKHLMIIDKADEVSQLINGILSSIH